LKLGDNFLRRELPLVIAHRGNKARYPENTLLALEDAVELGVDALEVDARLTRDGQLVIFHDETVPHFMDKLGHCPNLHGIKDLGPPLRHFGGEN
jgi:glycerophosphoryl diester phosphodiesterase